MAKKHEQYIPVLRGLISYHERMMLVTKKESPEANLQDVYLEALKESLRLMEREVSKNN